MIKINGVKIKGLKKAVGDYNWCVKHETDGWKGTILFRSYTGEIWCDANNDINCTIGDLEDIINFLFTDTVNCNKYIGKKHTSMKELKGIIADVLTGRIFDEELWEDKANEQMGHNIAIHR